jgi:uncharacterized membrane-anchored protein
MKRAVIFALGTGLLLTPGAALAQDDMTVEAFEASLTYERGTVMLGKDLATLEVPAEFRFLGPDDAQRLLTEGWGNPPMDAPLGMIVPSEIGPMSPEGWGVVITFEEDGYVEDDDAETLDYDELLAEIQADTRAESEAREDAGYESIELVGWAAPPHYDASTHKLYWAQELRFGDQEPHTLNYNIRVLGRRGVLVMNAVAGMSMLDEVETDMRSVMAFVDFNEGHRYTDFVPGADQVAVYGVGALVAGKVAAKVGLFKVLLAALVAGKKLVVVAFVALGAFLKKALGRKSG